jgi:pimeloyl-ACP methyl ester carboxylesterase
LPAGNYFGKFAAFEEASMAIILRGKDGLAPRKPARALTASLMAAAAILAASAIYVQWSASRSLRRNSPSGRFLTVEGVRLHYIDTGGKGPPILLLHGNGSMVRELEISGIIEQLSQQYRVIAFDRPGFGYSERPRAKAWTPAAQADLMHAAMRSLGLKSAIVLGHSWGTLVALELALRHSRFVRGLMLIAGFYFPEARRDLALLSLAAAPVFGDLMCYTLSPILARLLSRRARRMVFAPRPVSERFRKEFPVDLAIRPTQIRAALKDLAMLLPAAEALAGRYGRIRKPTIIIAGAEDGIVNVGRHGVRLQSQIPGSELYVLPHDGHMVHHHAPLTILQAADRLAERSRLVS